MEKVDGLEKLSDNLKDHAKIFDKIVSVDADQLSIDRGLKEIFDKNMIREMVHMIVRSHDFSEDQDHIMVDGYL